MVGGSAILSIEYERYHLAWASLPLPVKTTPARNTSMSPAR